MAFGILYFENGIRVSVPYRGLIFLNCSGFNFARGFESVSVPYRGLIFLNEENEQLYIRVLHFRPLPGTYISQLTHRRTIKGLSNFRPLPGTYISQWASHQKPHIQFVRFRPLPGTYISQW